MGLLFRMRTLLSRPFQTDPSFHIVLGLLVSFGVAEIFFATSYYVGRARANRVSAQAVAAAIARPPTSSAVSASPPAPAAASGHCARAEPRRSRPSGRGSRRGPGPPQPAGPVRSCPCPSTPSTAAPAFQPGQPTRSRWKAAAGWPGRAASGRSAVARRPGWPMQLPVAQEVDDLAAYIG